MTRSSRDKLNAIHLQGSLLLAALFAALSDSWWLFILISTALISSSLYTGEIRHTPSRRR